MPIDLTPFDPATIAPDTTPIGPLAVALDALRSLIAGVGYFQDWTGAPSAAAALKQVFVGEVGWPVTAVAIADGVLTVTTREPHTLEVGDTVTLTGAAGGAQGLGLDGALIVAGVTDTTFTASTTSDDQTLNAADAGLFVLPAARPYAVISEGGEGGDSVRGTIIASGGTAVYAGALEILLEDNVSSAYTNDPRNALTEARNKFGSFVQALAEVSGTGDYMVLNEITVLVAPAFVPLADGEDATKRFTRWQALIRVTWGIDG